MGEIDDKSLHFGQHAAHHDYINKTNLTLIGPGIFLRTRSPGGGGGFHPPYENPFLAWYELVRLYPPKGTYDRG